MARRSRPGPAVLALLAVMLPVAGCVTMPNGGPVLSFPVTQGPSAQGQSYLQLIPKPPAPGATPNDIVRGFLTASASFADGQRVAKEYLTPGAAHAWNPTWSATVFRGSGPQPDTPVPDPLHNGQVTVTVSGDVQAQLNASGAYAVPSASDEDTAPYTFRLARSGGQWRIVNPPPKRLLTSVEFNADYQLRNLYFLDPQSRFLVPDPVYVPLRTTPANLMNGLVGDLIAPPDDWLSTAAKSAFPRGTRLLSDVVVNGGAAEVNLGGSIARIPGENMRKLVSAQLLSTLSGSGQGQPLVRSVVLEFNGKAWSPPRTQQNPVQHSTSVKIPTGESGRFYYLDGKGTVWSASGAAGKRVKVQAIGTGFSAIAVSPDSRYLAALRGGQLFTGPLGGPLVKRAGAGYGSISWDGSGNVWAVSHGQVYTLAGSVTAQSARGPQGEAVPVAAVAADGTSESEPVTAVRVAPDGVRVAVVIGGARPMLKFGAVVRSQTAPQAEQHPNLQPVAEQIDLAPFYVSGGQAGFSAVSWYGADSVITVGAQPGPGGPTLNGYSVNGGQINTMPTQAGIQSVTASFGSELVAGTRDGHLLAAASTSGAWTPIGKGSAPAYPG